MNNSNTIHFRGINALRFFSAMAIIVYHCKLSGNAPLEVGIPMLLHNLPLGVDFFFIISGFLITYLLLIEKENTKTISLKKFYTRRILRICPLYFLVVGLTYWRYHANYTHIDFVPYAYFFGNFQLISFGNWTGTPLDPLWSICIEEHFYLFAPLFLFFTPIKKTHYLFGFIILASLLFRVYNSIYEVSWMTVYCHSLSRCDVIAMGGLLAHYYHQSPKSLNLNPITIFFAAIMLFLLLAVVDNLDFSTFFHAVFKKYVFIIPLLILFIGIALNNHNNGVLQWLKNNKMMDYLGKVSFGMYMFHVPVSVFLHKFPTITGSIGVYFICVTLLTIFVSIASYELFEKQFLKLKKRFQVVRSNIECD